MTNNLKSFKETLDRLAEVCGRVATVAAPGSPQETFYAEAEFVCKTLSQKLQRDMVSEAIHQAGHASIRHAPSSPGRQAWDSLKSTQVNDAC